MLVTNGLDVKFDRVVPKTFRVAFEFRASLRESMCLHRRFILALDGVASEASLSAWPLRSYHIGDV
jgi:hypothetical protein